MGGESELTALAKAAIREAARVEVILAALGDELLSTGPLTGKGKMRAASTLYLKTLDRFVRVVVLLDGLQRRQRPVDPLEAVRRAVEAANEAR